MHYTDRPEWAAFLQAIIENPADDLPRLVLCDWLDELGETDRSEFIRVQLELAKYPDDYKVEVPPIQQGRNENTPEELRFVHLLRRQWELWDAGLWSVYRDGLPCGVHVMLPGWIGGSLIEAHPRRGFVSSVRCDLASWLTIGPSVVTAHPVEDVRITDREPWSTGAQKYGWLVPSEEVSPFGDSRRSQIPRDVMTFLRDGANAQKLHDTPDAAIAALSARLIFWAKSQPLTPVPLPA
jgi:uncharacterized protein (TIGR02996 family)